MIKKTQKSLQKEESKRRILNVASRLFRKQGFKATGVDQLMNEAGLTAGAFYAHFDSKEDLFAQCLELALEQSKILLQKDTEHLTGEAKTKAIIGRYCSDAHRDFPDRGCVLPALASEIHQVSTRSNEVIALYIDRWAALIREHLPNELSPEQKSTLALQLISRSVGAILLSRVTRDHSMSEDILRAAQEI